MSLTENGTGTTMLVQPSGFGNMGGTFGGFGGFGGDGAWLLLFLLCMGNGMWGGFGGGMWPMMMGMGGGLGGWGMDYLYPWLNNSQNINGGFRDQALNSQISDARTDINRGFGDVQLGQAAINQNICQTGNGIVSAVTGAQNALTQQMYANQIADMERSYNAQTATTGGLTNISAQLANCCCENRAATQDVKYTIATEACATRAANAQNTQAILDKLCQLELDGVKGQLAQAQRENVGLQNAVNMANMQASQVAQTAQILAGQTAEVDALYNRLKNCPVGTMPVYGNTPIFSCPQNAYSGCGCNG